MWQRALSVGGGSLPDTGDFQHTRAVSTTVASRVNPAISFSNHGTPTEVYLFYTVGTEPSISVNCITNVNPETKEIATDKVWRSNSGKDDGAWFIEDGGSGTPYTFNITNTSISLSSWLSSASITVVFVWKCEPWS